MGISSVFSNSVSQLLERVATPFITIGDRKISTFLVCGWVGVISASGLTSYLISLRELSHALLLLLIIVAIATFLSLAMLMKVLVGEERLIYYHQEVAVLLTVGTTLWLLGESILAYLEIILLGIGLFLAFGRIGCFLVGCCHGLPSSWGVTYSDEHRKRGFTHYFVGVRLMPVQLIESSFVFLIVLVGTLLVRADASPGAALVWYIIAYDTLRFFLEFWRGDPDRPYFSHLSEPQWISILLVMLVLGLGLGGILPMEGFHYGAALLLLLAAVTVELNARLGQRAAKQFFHPHHLSEFAHAYAFASDHSLPVSRSNNLSDGSPQLYVGFTSKGLRVSASTIRDGSATCHHFALSHEEHPLAQKTAERLVGLIAQEKYPGLNSEIRCAQSVTHLLVYEPVIERSGQ